MRIDRALVAVLSCCLLPTAEAQFLQLKPSAHVGVAYDDNVFRTTVGNSAGIARVGDTLTTAGVGARITFAHSLQSLELSGEVDHIDYAKLDALDYDRYRIGAQAKLAYASLLKLKLDAGRERRQENFAFRDDAESSFITVDDVQAELRLAVTPHWAGIARAALYNTEASRLASQDSDLEEHSGELGVEYRRNGYSSFELGLRATQGDYPRRNATAGDGRETQYDQQSLLSRVTYAPSGLSQLTAQLAFTQRLHSDAAVPDFRGFTGRLSYLRRFSGISQLQFEAYRDLFYVEDVNANYVENLGLKASYDYRWSAKLAFAAAAEYYGSSYKGSPRQNVAGRARQDDVLSFRIGADYQPFYRFSILPEYRYERRGSNLLDSRYDFNVIGVDLAYEYGLRSRR